MITSERVTEFWNWFRANNDRLISLVDTKHDRAVADALGAQVKAVDERLGWEIGPGQERELALVISPNGRAELLPVAEMVIAEAPAMPRWEFHSSKPPKKWDYRFRMLNSNGQTVELDAQYWEYILTSYNDGEFYDVILVANNRLDMDEVACRQAGFMVVESILGEKRCLERIGDVFLADRVPFGQAMEMSRLVSLSQHLDSLEEEKKEREKKERGQDPGKKRKR